MIVACATVHPFLHPLPGLLAVRRRRLCAVRQMSCAVESLIRTSCLPYIQFRLSIELFKFANAYSSPQRAPVSSIDRDYIKDYLSTVLPSPTVQTIMLRTALLSLVMIVAAFAIDCSRNEVPVECARALICQPSCSQPNGGVCPRMCGNPSCECKPGFVRNDKLECVAEKQCQPGSLIPHLASTSLPMSRGGKEAGCVRRESSGHSVRFARAMSAVMRETWPWPMPSFMQSECLRL